MSKPVESQADIAARALDQKQNSVVVPHAPQAEEGTGETADNGMRSTPREDYPASGAFDAEGQRPVLERSRKVR
jgi:hypothetical protein